MSLNKPISCCSGAIRREKPRSCWSDFIKRALRFALNLEILLLSLGRRLSSISVWTQRELAKSLRFTAIFLAMDCRIISHLSFVSTATSNQSMKPTAPLRSKLTNSLPFSRPSAFPSMSHRFPLAPFSVFATTPWISSRCPASLVRLKLVLCPHSLAPTLVVLPSMSLGPPLHSLGSRTPAVMLFNASRGLSLSR